MVSTALLMPRVRRSYKIDERVTDALMRAAAKSNMSANRYLENLLFSHAQTVGEIPLDAQPLGETRGGDRTTNKGSDDEPT
jgi:hypothetical protein